MYRADIPALPKVASDCGALHLDRERAKAVRKDTPFDVNDVVDASIETQARKRVKRSHNESVTEQEVGDAIIREHAVTAAHVASRFPGVVAAGADIGPVVGADPALFNAAIGPAVDAAVGPAVNAALEAVVEPPAWFNAAIGPAVNAAVGPAVTAAIGPAVTAAIGPAVTAALAAVVEPPVWFNAAIGPALTAALAAVVEPPAWFNAAIGCPLLSLEIRIDNMNIKRRNKLQISGGPNNSLQPLRKQVNGNGLGLPGFDVPPAQLPEGLPLAVGHTVAYPFFPRTENDLSEMTNRQLSVLSILYNNDFGIIHGDSLAARRTKFKEFIS